MTGAGTAPSATATTRRPRRGRLVPPQHGAWAMLAVPYLAGLLVAGYRWPDVPLLGAWLAGYPLSYFALRAVVSRRPSRYRRPLAVYGGVAVPLLTLVVLVRPAVLWYAPAYALLLAVNTWYAWRRRERSLLNDASSVAQSSLILLVVATIAGSSPVFGMPSHSAASLVPGGANAGVPPAFALCLGYLLGTVLFVKTMIRERGDRAYRRWSAGYHLVALAVAGWWAGPWAAAFFAWLLARAVLLPRLRLHPKQVGLVELANSALLLACIALH